MDLGILVPIVRRPSLPTGTVRILCFLGALLWRRISDDTVTCYFLVDLGAIASSVYFQNIQTSSGSGQATTGSFRLLNQQRLIIPASIARTLSGICPPQCSLFNVHICRHAIHHVGSDGYDGHGRCTLPSSRQQVLQVIRCPRVHRSSCSCRFHERSTKSPSVDGHRKRYEIYSTRVHIHTKSRDWWTRVGR